MRIKTDNTVLLALCVLVLAVLCIVSVSSPMRFDSERAERERAVKARLVKIRSAEERYRLSHGAYAASFDQLVRSGLLADSLRYIPYAGGRQFGLRTSTTAGRGGERIPLMECGATYAQYLDGLDKASVENLMEEAGAAGRFPGLKIGDLEMPGNNAGNWE